MKLCKFNPGIECANHSKCNCCGWNPKIDENRKKILRSGEKLVVKSILSEREKQVKDLFDCGMLDDEIAIQLKLATRTIANIRRALGLKRETGRKVEKYGKFK